MIDHEEEAMGEQRYKEEYFYEDKDEDEIM